MANGLNNRVFDTMEMVADKTNVDINSYAEVPKDRKSIHNALMVAGMTPGIGNIADITDATLYALEGEFGDAAWSAAAAIPVIGQMVSGKKALKAAKEAGEEMVTLYRGVDKFVGGGKWYKESKEYIPGGTRKKEGIFTTTKKDIAEIDFNKPGGIANEVILEFEVPKSYKSKYGKEGWLDWDILFEDGIPKEFLKKVHK